MRRVFFPSAILAAAGPPVLAIIVAWFLSLVPREIIGVAVIWVLVSLPPAMFFGHCALDSEA